MITRIACRHCWVTWNIDTDQTGETMTCRSCEKPFATWEAVWFVRRKKQAAAICLLIGIGINAPLRIAAGGVQILPMLGAMLLLAIPVLLIIHRRTHMGWCAFGWLSLACTTIGLILRSLLLWKDFRDDITNWFALVIIVLLLFGWRVCWKYAWAVIATRASAPSPPGRPKEK